MSALRVTDPFDPEPAAPPVPQLSWPQRRPGAAVAETESSEARQQDERAERSWRRHARPALQRA
ncbi:hypothetical protein CKO44_11240 [Rubrivivax gelatinosus]|uniref:Uncharacterized protein n=1 Tax=Rubrivivax gelatinosus TaxID=28068 RepID=A0ABS1E279_RUBGE|nr:hypothetical protein [Rubrivivax gelatinosus]MBK1614041.1 hypothetical protein [Rubrivivax gelatinosus]MBK1715943.1 hypothetical protein [Rubrivivax gelatinosus]